MIDNVGHLLAELKKSNRKLESHLRRVLLSTKIITHKSGVVMDLACPRPLDCFFSCRIPPDQNTLGKEIEILIKPDHSEKRELRLIIQVGDHLLLNKKESIDKNKWDDSIVFRKELKATERDVKRALKKAA